MFGKKNPAIFQAGCNLLAAQSQHTHEQVDYINVQSYTGIDGVVQGLRDMLGACPIVADVEREDDCDYPVEQRRMIPTENANQDFNYDNYNQRAEQNASHTHKYFWERKGGHQHQERDHGSDDNSVQNRDNCEVPQDNTEYHAKWHDDQIIAKKADFRVITLAAHANANPGNDDVDDCK